MSLQQNQQQQYQYNVNIQQLISEYKQKLNQAIRKEDKDLIMKNIMAYQQMMGNSSQSNGSRLN